MKLAGRAGWNAFGQVIGLAAQLALTPYLLVKLGLDRYGLWALVGTIVTFVSAADGGVGAACGYFFALHRGDGDRAAATRLAATAAGAFAVFGALLTVAIGFGMPAALHLFHLPQGLRGEALALRFLIGPMVAAGLLFGVFTALLQAHDRFRASGIIATARAAALVAGTIACLQAGAGLQGLAVVTVGSSLLGLGLSVAAAAGHLDAASAGPVRRPEARALFTYASRLQLSSLTVLVNVELDALIIGMLLPVRAVGLYTIAANVANGARTLPVYFLAPIFTRLALHFGEGGLPAARAAYRRLSTPWAVGVSGYAVVGIAGIGFAVRAWLGPLYAETGWVAAIVFAGYGVNLFTGVGSVFARAIGRPGLETRYAVCCTVINLALTVPFGLWFGLVGVVTATAVGSVIGSVYFFRILGRALPEEAGLRRSDFRPAVLAGAGLVTLVGELAVLRTGESGLAGLALSLVPIFVALAAYGWGTRSVVTGLGSGPRLVEA